jgi:hypothetical protein
MLAIPKPACRAFQSIDGGWPDLTLALFFVITVSYQVALTLTLTRV